MPRLSDDEKEKITKWLTDNSIHGHISRPDAMRMSSACHVKMEKLEVVGLLSRAKGFRKGENHEGQRLVDAGFALNMDALSSTISSMR